MKKIASLIFIILINFQSLADLGSLCVERPSKQDTIIYVNDVAKRNLINKFVLSTDITSLEDKEFKELVELISPIVKKFICDPNTIWTNTKNYNINSIKLTDKYSLITVLINLFAYNGEVFNFLWDGEKLSVAFFPESDNGKILSDSTPITSIYIDWDAKNKCLTNFQKAVGYDSVAGTYANYYFMKIVNIPILPYSETSTDEDYLLEKRKKIISMKIPIINVKLITN